MISPTAQMEQKISRVRRQYREEMRAKDIAREEGISTDTASKRMADFEYGPLTKRSKRDVRCFTEGYIEYLRSKVVLQKGAA